MKFFFAYLLLGILSACGGGGDSQPSLNLVGNQGQKTLDTATNAGALAASALAFSAVKDPLSSSLLFGETLDHQTRQEQCLNGNGKQTVTLHNPDNVKGTGDFISLVGLDCNFLDGDASIFSNLTLKDEILSYDTVSLNAVLRRTVSGHLRSEQTVDGSLYVVQTTSPGSFIVNLETYATNEAGFYQTYVRVGQEFSIQATVNNKPIAQSGVLSGNCLHSTHTVCKNMSATVQGYTTTENYKLSISQATNLTYASGTPVSGRLVIVQDGKTSFLDFEGSSVKVTNSSDLIKAGVSNYPISELEAWLDKNGG